MEPKFSASIWICEIRKPMAANPMKYAGSYPKGLVNLKRYAGLLNPINSYS